MTPADPPIFPPAPTPDDSAFDATFWKAVNAAFDEALECDEIARPAFVRSLHERDARVAQEVRKLLGRAHAQTLATSFVRHTPTSAGASAAAGLTTQLAPVLGDTGERGFDHLLQRALRAERSRTKDRRHSGELCGAWRLQEVIGVGGMGEVWLATRADGLYQAKAAVKFLRADGDTERFEARFAQERALLARLNHPGIARLIDAGRLFGQPFLVLEYVDGQPLLNYAAEHAPTVEARIALIREIGEAVSYAHSQLVVHRDLKPSNVLVTPGGHVKLLDFGVAGLLDDSEKDEATTSEATKMGGRGLTVEYAAPEQISGEATGVACDIYSLGSLAYHLLSGRRAHLPEKTGRAALEYAVLHVTPERLSWAATHHHHATVKDNIPAPSDAERLEGDVDAIISRAIRIDPADRYRTMEAFVADLTRWMQHRPISARREDRSYRTRLWLRRNWLPVSLTASLFVALVTGLAFSLWQYDRARVEAARAVKTADYLVELLRSADPDVHGGHWPTVLALIEQAQKDLASKFADDPSVEQQVGVHVATTLRRLSRFKEALPVARRSVLLSEKLYGDQAEATRRAKFLLADIMYWVDETAAALPLVEQAIGKGPPPSLQTWWREAILLRANMLAELRRFSESNAEFDHYLTLVRGEPLEQWLTAEAEVDRALMYSREGRRAEALALHRKLRPILENPPPHAKRVALNALTNGAFEQVQAGDPTGVEALLKDSIRQWDELAGKFNANSLDALCDLGFFYNRFGEPQSALATYEERLTRLRAAPAADAAAVVFGELDLLEVRTRYLMLDKAATLTEAKRLTEAFLALDAASATSDQKRRFRQRVALVELTYGKVDGTATAIVAETPPSADFAKIGRTEASRRYILQSMLESTGGRGADACKSAQAAVAAWGADNRGYVLASYSLRAAIVCTLAGESSAATLSTDAINAIPKELPDDHRLRQVGAYLAQLQQARDKAQVDAALTEFLSKIRSGVNSVTSTEISASLTGLAF